MEYAGSEAEASPYPSSEVGFRAGRRGPGRHGHSWRWQERQRCLALPPAHWVASQLHRQSADDAGDARSLLRTPLLRPLPSRDPFLRLHPQEEEAEESYEQAPPQSAQKAQAYTIIDKRSLQRIQARVVRGLGVGGRRTVLAAGRYHALRSPHSAATARPAAVGGFLFSGQEAAALRLPTC